MAALVLAVAGCERQPDAAGEGEGGALPVVVAQAEEGPFAVERRFGGQVRAAGEVRVVVREAGEVVAVGVDGRPRPVRAGQLLLRLRSTELDLEAREAQAVVASRAAEAERMRRLVELGLEPETRLDLVRAEHEQALLRLERLGLRQGLLEVRSPVGGLLLESDLPDVGQFCVAGTEVARVVDPASLVVDVVVPASWGQAELAGAVLETSPGREVEAVVLALSAAADPSTGGRTLTLRPAEVAGLAPGAVVAARLLEARRDRAVTVPAEAVFTSREGEPVVAVGPAPGETGPVRRAKVVPGPSDGQRTVIEQGVAAGAWVVARDPGGTEYWGRYLGVRR